MKTEDLLQLPSALGMSGATCWLSKRAQSLTNPGLWLSATAEKLSSSSAPHVSLDLCVFEKWIKVLVATGSEV